MVEKNKSHSAKKLKGGPFCRPVLYATRKKRKNLFDSVPWANKFVEVLAELFWSLQEYRKKTLTKSHDHNRLFSYEKRQLKITQFDKKRALS